MRLLCIAAAALSFCGAALAGPPSRPFASSHAPFPRGTLRPTQSTDQLDQAVAAFTKGGPPRKIVPCSRTITLSSLIAGT